MTLRIIVAAILAPVLVVVVAVALYLAMDSGDSGPDSGHITFYSDRDGDSGIDGEYLMNADGSGVGQLTHNEAEDFVQNWLPVPDSLSSS